MSAPSIVIEPENGGHNPTSVRARVDFPDADGPITAQHFAGPHGECQVGEDQLSCIGGGDAKLVDDEVALGCRQRGAQRRLRLVLQQLCELAEQLARLDERLPLADSLLDRRQRAAEDDRAGDDRARADIAA